MTRKKLGLVFGGRSAEHDVSIMSSKSVFEVINKAHYMVTIFYISKNGQWHLVDDLYKELPEEHDGHMIESKVLEALYQQETILPIIHGPYGEDGKLQGFLDTLDIPYVGSKVLSSAISMDKIISKHLLEKEGFEIAAFYSLTNSNKHDKNSLKAWLTKSGYPVFVKPSNMGSSVGITKVLNYEMLEKAIENAWCFDDRLIIEQGIVGREIECAVLEGESLMVSGVGEVISSHEFYDYTAKYVDDGQAKMSIPAKNIDIELVSKIKELAKKAFEIHDCNGLARIDFFVEEQTNRIIINELNTLPGMTTFSMYPELFKVEGITYEKLIDTLIASAKTSS